MKNLLIKNTLARRAASFFVLLSIAFSLLPLSANAQTTEPSSRQLVMKEKTAVMPPARLALVIGNANYENIDKLKNPAADATDMTVALKSLGFEVISGIDQNKKQMMTKIREFGDKLNSQKGVGVVFYAGHGVQSKGKNYLIPVDADIPREDEIPESAINIGLLLAKFETAGNELNILILDACRSNPFAKEWSEFSSGDGIGKIVAPTGTILWYATEPGKAASDGAGRNGLFTQALLENITKPNVELDALSKLVGASVSQRSKKLQIPYKEGPNFNDFYFAGNTTAVSPVLSSDAKISDDAEPEIKEKSAAAVEQDIWNLVKNSKNSQDFREFLREYPNAVNAEKAKKILEQLVWDSIKATNDATQVENYLKEFPNGMNVKTANFRLRQLKTRESVEPAKTETAKVEPPVTETAKTETAKAEPEESALPVKKSIVPKAETPKAVARTVKTKVKPSVSETSKYPVRTNSFGMELVRLPAGSFMMGASEANLSESYTLARKEDAEIERTAFDNEKLQHKVTFAEDFWIGKTEITQAQWTAVMNDNPSRHTDCADCPVERFSWDDAKKFIQKLNEQNDGFEYRLPSEAEWEYAARGGKTGILPVAVASVARMVDFAWYHVNAGEDGLATVSHPVAQLQPNGFGLYDMLGNVAEWCEDSYTENYDNSPADGTPDMSGDPKNRVLRGGFFNDLTYRLRVTRRDKLMTHIRRSENGLRIVAVEKK